MDWSKLIVPFLAWALVQYLKKNRGTRDWALEHTPGVLAAVSAALAVVQGVWQAAVIMLAPAAAHAATIASPDTTTVGAPVVIAVGEIIRQAGENWVGGNLFDNIVRKALWNWLVKKVLAGIVRS